MNWQLFLPYGFFVTSRITKSSRASTQFHPFRNLLTLPVRYRNPSWLLHFDAKCSGQPRQPHRWISSHLGMSHGTSLRQTVIMSPPNPSTSPVHRIRARCLPCQASLSPLSTPLFSTRSSRFLVLGPTGQSRGCSVGTGPGSVLHLSLRDNW